MLKAILARRYLVCGRVQGVGFRYFVELAAREIGVTGWVRNLANGCVEVHANGTSQQLDDLASRVRQGPPRADVRTVDVQDTAVSSATNFHIR